MTENPRFSLDETQRITDYCKEEVRRQYYGQSIPEYAVPGMVRAWFDALFAQARGTFITPDLVAKWGAYIEPGKNAAGYRSIPIFVGYQEKLPYPLIDRAMFTLCYGIKHDHFAPLEAYREFEEIHPFEDGNGRTGKIILNWVNGTLLDPIFPPEDFWGPRLINP